MIGRPETGVEDMQKLRQELAELDFRLPDNWTQGREPRAGLAIDPEHSPDRDSALSLTQEAPGDVLHVSVADVGSYLYKQALVRKHAAILTRSVYRRDRVVAPMIPAAISEGVLSLLPDAERPVLTAHLPVSSVYGMAVPSFSFERMQAESVTPEAMAARVADQEPQAVALAGVARRLYNMRTDNSTENFVIETEEGRVMPGNLQQLIGSLIVQESSIYYNYSLALFMREHTIPGVYRLCEDDPSSDAWQTGLARASYSLQPGVHAYLNLMPYAHVGTPLRRVVSFANQCNLVAFLEDRRYPFTKEDLRHLASRSNRIAANDAAQRRLRPGGHNRSKQPKIVRAAELIEAIQEGVANVRQLTDALFEIGVGDKATKSTAQSLAAQYVAANVGLSRAVISSAEGRGFMQQTPTDKQNRATFTDNKGNEYSLFTGRNPIARAKSAVRLISDLCGEPLEATITPAMQRRMLRSQSYMDRQNGLKKQRQVPASPTKKSGKLPSNDRNNPIKALEIRTGKVYAAHPAYSFAFNNETGQVECSLRVTDYDGTSYEATVSGPSNRLAKQLASKALLQQMPPLPSDDVRQELRAAAIARQASTTN